MAADSPHGTRQRYRSGCKCKACRKAVSDYELSRRDYSPEAARKRADAQTRYYRRNRERQLKARRLARATPRGKAQKAKYRKRRANGALTDLGVAYGAVLLGDPCSYCGGGSGEIDHIHPIAHGGTGEFTNLTAACRACNARKYTKSLLHFLLE